MTLLKENKIRDGSEAKKLLALVADVSHKDVSKMNLDDNLIESLNLDSLDVLELLAAIEKHFNIIFPDEFLSNLGTFRKLLNSLDISIKEEVL